MNTQKDYQNKYANKMKFKGYRMISHWVHIKDKKKVQDYIKQLRDLREGSDNA